MYAAMGVVSAAAGFGMAAVPARFGLSLRRRPATASAFVLPLPLPLPLPLLRGESLLGPYAVVIVLGVA